MAKRLTFFLFFTIAISLCYGQVNELPIHFGQFFNNPQINPAEGGSEGKMELSIGTKQNAGVFSGVKTSFASVNVRLAKKERNFHVLGLHFNNDREGLVIRRNRAAMSYSRHLSISEKWMLAAGVSAGIYDFAIKSNPVTRGANSSTEDFSGGLHLYNDTKYLSFSVNQLSGSQVQPLEQIIKLLPLYQLRYRHRVILDDDLNITPIAFIKYAVMDKNKDKYHGGLGLRFSLMKLVRVGASYETNEGVHLFLGLMDITKKTESRGIKKDNRFNFELSYFAPGKSNTRTNINAFELTCQYFIF